MTGETPANREQLPAGEFNRRLHDKLVARLHDIPIDSSGTRFFAYTEHGSSIEVSDYFFYEHTTAQGQQSQAALAEAREAALHNGTAILSLRSQEPAHADTPYVLLFRPVDVDPGGMTGALVAEDGIDMGSEEYTMWGKVAGERGRITPPQRIALAQDLAALEAIEAEQPPQQQ